MTRTARCLAATGLLLLLAGIRAAEPKADPAQQLPNDLGSYTHINSIVVPSPDSPVTGFHHFSINDRGLKTFQSGPGGKKFPAGTVLVGRVYKPVKTRDGAYKEGNLLAYTLMTRRPDDPTTRKTGGWLWQKFDARGKPVEINPVKDCFSCHQPHKESDYVISRPLE